MRILITGSSGLIGSAFKTVETKHEMVYSTSKDTNLMDQFQVMNLISGIKPDAIIHCAAKVGGVAVHKIAPWDLLYNNTLMNANVCRYAAEFGVKKLLAFSSVCAMPDGLPALKEDLMHSAPPPVQNYEYGYAKRMIDVMIGACKKQFGVENWCSIISTNVFGERDDYKLETCHVLPALIHKMFLAKRDKTSFPVWGNGSPRREFVFSEDLARMLLQIIELDSIPQRIIVANPKEYTIKEVVELLCKSADFQGEVVWQLDKPNGQHARPSDTSLLQSLVDVKYTPFEDAIYKSYKWFESNYPNVRI